MSPEMMSIQQELSQVLEDPSLRFNEQYRLDHQLESGQQLLIRCSPDASGLLLAIPVGRLRQEHWSQRAVMLLKANHHGLPFGGGFGNDADSGEVYASRYFPIGTGADLRAVANEFGDVCRASRIANLELEIVNSLQFDASGAATISEADLNAANRSAESALNDENPCGQSPDLRTTVADWEQALSAALRYCGISFSGLDEDHCWYAQTSDGFYLKIAFDAELESISLVACLGTIGRDRAPALASDWLAENLTLRGTGNCVLGLAEDSSRSEFLATLSLLFSFPALGPAPSSLGNLITGILSNAQRTRTRLGLSFDENDRSSPPAMSLESERKENRSPLSNTRPSPRDPANKVFG